MHIYVDMFIYMYISMNIYVRIHISVYTSIYMYTHIPIMPVEIYARFRYGLQSEALEGYILGGWEVQQLYIEDSGVLS